MKIAGSILNISDKSKLIDFSNSGIDFIHVDVMDNKFVLNHSLSYEEYSLLLKDANLPLDVHLMVSDIYKYIDEFVNLNPLMITFHYEATSNIIEVINYIKSFNIKVGLSIKPSTEVKEIEKYLSFVDLVLLMSVDPGKGGQTFMENTLLKLEQLKKYDEKFIVSVDGGINENNIQKLKNYKADIVVVGSYITSSNNYQKQVLKLKGLIWKKSL